MEGDELARQVRTLEPDLKVLYLSTRHEKAAAAPPCAGAVGFCVLEIPLRKEPLEELPRGGADGT